MFSAQAFEWCINLSWALIDANEVKLSGFIVKDIVNIWKAYFISIINAHRLVTALLAISIHWCYNVIEITVRKGIVGDVPVQDDC